MKSFFSAHGILSQWRHGILVSSIKHDNQGKFHFGAVQGEIDGRIEMLDDVPRFSFSWEGNDEMDKASGRGWVMHDGKQLIGHIYFHMGEESAFRATHE